MDSENITCHKWILHPNTNHDLTLTQVNEKLVLRFLGGMSLVCFLISIGLVGNAHVLYIYTRIFKPGSNYRIFVIFLAMLDVFNLAVSAPMVVYYLVHPVTYPSDIFCKIFRFVMYFANVASTSALIVIAIDRGQRTLAPFRKKTTPRQAKLMCAVSLLVALLLAWPTPLLYGVDNVPTGFHNLHGYRCLAEDINPIYITTFLICQTSFFFVVSLSLCIVYGLLGWKIYKYGVAKRKSATSRRESETTERQVTKSTFTLVIVTLVYIFSSLPHHILAPMYFLIPDFDCELTLPHAIVYYTFIYSCFVNNAINPFIYGFRDRKFGREMRKLYGFDA